MKKINLIKSYLILTGLLVLIIASCTKDPNGVFSGKGAPVINSVRTLSKTDSTKGTTIVTYDTTGTASTTTNPGGVTVVKADSTTDTGNLGNNYVILGQNLGTTTKILINGVSIYFNRALNSDNSVVFTIPTNIPTTQPQSNTIVLTTLYGTVTYKFTVVPPAPSITTTSDYDFTAGSTLTFTGVTFLPVTSIKLKGTNDALTIVSRTDTTMTVTMPQSTATRATLVFTYTSGSNAGATSVSTQEFVNLDNAYVIFDKNNFQNGWADNSWAHPSGVSTAASHSGTASIVASYPANGWQIEGWDGYSAANGGLEYSATYKYLTFWVKGGISAHTLVLVGDKMVGGYGQVQNANAAPSQLIPVPAGVWTYFKIPLGTANNVTMLNYWATGNLAQQLGFFLQGGLTSVPDVNETLYFDEVAFTQ